MNEPARPPRAITAAAFLSSFDRFAISPLLVLVAVEMHARLPQALAVASVYYLTYGLGQPLWGVLSDRFGRIRLMRLTLLGSAVAGLVATLATTLPLLIGARAVGGFFFGAVVPAALTYVGDTVGLERRQSALADLMAAIAVGTATATALAGVIGDHGSWRIAFAIPAVLAVVCFFGLGRLSEPGRDASGSIAALVRTSLTSPWVLIVIGLAFVEGAVVLGVLTLLAPALQSRGIGATGAGLAIAAYGIGVIISSRLVSPASRRLRMPALMAIGGGAAVLGYGLIAAQLSITAVIITATLLGVTWSFLHSSLQTWATTVIPEARGTVIALFAGSLFAGSALGTSGAGMLADLGRWNLLFALTAAIGLILTAAAVIARHCYARGR